MSIPMPPPPDAAEILAAQVQVWSIDAAVPIGPWLARGGTGPDGSTGSAALVGEPPAPGQEMRSIVDRVEAWYRTRRERPAFELPSTAAAPVHDELIRRGYLADATRAAVVHSVPIRTLRAAAPASRDGRVRISATPTQEWLHGLADIGAGDRTNTDGDAGAAPHPPHGAPVHAPPVVADRWALTGRCAFAAQVADGRVVAIALGVVTGPLLDVCLLATDAPRRRRGSGRRLVGALATWATANAARSACATLRGDGDPAARALLDGLGFVEIARSVVLVAPE